MFKLLLHVIWDTAVPADFVRRKHFIIQIVVKLPAVPHVFPIAGYDFIISIIP